MQGPKPKFMLFGVCNITASCFFSYETLILFYLLDISVVVINGNLSRLRNGYYPSFFYPGLNKVSKSFYSNSTQAVYLIPLSVNGNRFGAWIAKTYSSDLWQLLVRSPKGGFDIAEKSLNEFNPNVIWKVAKEAYSVRWPGMF